MNKLIKYVRVLRSKNIRYTLFRLKYELERRTGLLSKKYPTMLRQVPIPFLEKWRINGCGWFYVDRYNLNVAKNKAPKLKEKMDHILKGDVLFFCKTWKSLGLDYDWVTNPETKYRYNAEQHWTKINDFSKEAGDIKFVWEKSRFSWLLPICRYDYHFDEDHSEFVLEQILDWIEKNPLNSGPNYKCSQETSIRILNWLFALNFYSKSNIISEERWKTIIASIFWQTDHVYKNIDFSRVCVRNNHVITETLTLYLVGLLFPEMPNAKQWKKKGKRWFEQEIEYQFYPDGTYLQQSMNYQRVVTQLLTLGIALAEKNGERFNDVVYQRAYANLNFLYQMQDGQSGWLPNYGANDGALFFQLSDADYRDYRPQLDALHYVLTGKPLYGKLLEDAEWYGVSLKKEQRYAPLTLKQGATSFKDGGYHVIRRGDRMAFIRCGMFKGKIIPDQMHIDVWRNGENVLMDGGSYLYNTDEKTRAYFAGTESANAIMLGNNGQMKKGPRFMWFYPSRIIGEELKEMGADYLFEGKIETFRAIAEGIVWHRTIRINRELTEIEVADNLDNKPDDKIMRQIWHTKSDLVVFESAETCEEKTGWYSDYYGVKEENRQIELVTKGNHILTKIILKG